MPYSDATRKAEEGEEQSGENGAAAEFCADYALVTEDVCDDDLEDTEENTCIDSYLRTSATDCLDEMITLADCMMASPSAFYCFESEVVFDYTAACMPEAETFMPCTE